MQKEGGNRIISSRGRSFYYLLAILLVITFIFLDQVTKNLIRGNFQIGESITVIPGILWITRVENSGVAFGLAQGMSLLLSIISLFILIMVLAFFVNIIKAPAGMIAISLVISGALGNLIDRMIIGTVTDYIDFGFWPVFNLADSCIVVGILLMLIIYFRQNFLQKETVNG